MRKLTREQKRDIGAITAERDEDIDFSDAPAVLDWSGAEIGKFYRPTKKPVTMRLDSDIIAWLKADGRGYQTKANWLLRNAMLHFKNEANVGRRKVAARRAKPAGGGNTSDQPEGFTSSVSSSTRYTTERASQRCSAGLAFSKNRVMLREALLKATTRVAPPAGLEVAVAV